MHRDGVLPYEGDFWYAFLGDTFTKDRLTVSAGLRFDHQTGKNRAGLIEANPAFPELLPAIDYPGGGTGISWSNTSPRVGITYALNDERRTVLRASFAQYANKLNLGASSFDNPLGGAYQAYFWNDTNGDGLPTASEVDIASGIQYFGGHDPANPASLTAPNRIDPDYKAPKETEFIVGLDHELAPRSRGQQRPTTTARTPTSATGMPASA